MNSAGDIESAWVTMGTRPEARIAREKLLTILMEVESPLQSDGALRHHEGRRSLARELISLLDKDAPAHDPGSSIPRTSPIDTRAAASASSSEYPISAAARRLTRVTRDASS